MNNIKKPIVIVGSGFGGINAALNLRKINPNFSILVIDIKTQFEFKPLLYEVFSNEIKSWEVNPSFNSIYSNSGITFIRNQVNLINFDKNLLILQDNLKVEFEYLILSTGSSPNDFSIKGVKEYCSFFSTNKDQSNLKKNLDQTISFDTNNKIFIIGAGPSGVELACKVSDLYKSKFEVIIVEQTSEILQNSKTFNKEEAEKTIEKKNINLMKNHSVIEITDEQILLSNNLNQVEKFPYFEVIWTAGIKPNLPEFNKQIQTINSKIFNKEEAEKTIEKKNINLMKNYSVAEINDEQILLSNNLNQVESFRYFNVIWTAGIRPNLPEFNQQIQTINNKILINNNLQLQDHPNIFALGDISQIKNNNNYPVTAQVAMQQGQHVATNLKLLINNQKLLPFKFNDNGEMMSLGIGEASISGLGFTFSGKLAYDLRRIIYASKMPKIGKGLKSTTSWFLEKKSIFKGIL